MNPTQRVKLAVGASLAAASLWACTATRNADGSMTFEFAPDMVITAWGLESASRQLTDLLADCVNGTFPRPCTDAERRDIVDTINKIVEVKERMGSPSNPAPGGTRD